MATHRREPDQGEGCSHAKVIASYITPYSLALVQLHDSYMVINETSVMSIVSSPNKAHVLKATHRAHFHRATKNINGVFTELKLTQI